MLKGLVAVEMLVQGPNVPSRVSATAGPPGGDIEMGIQPQPTPEPADKHMDEFYKEVSLIKVASRPHTMTRALMSHVGLLMNDVFAYGHLSVLNVLSTNKF